MQRSQTILALGTQGRTARMAQDFGDHPDVAATRMRRASSTALIACSDAGNERRADREPDAGLTRAPRQPYLPTATARTAAAHLPPAPSRHRVPRLLPPWEADKGTRPPASGQRMPERIYDRWPVHVGVLRQTRPPSAEANVDHRQRPAGPAIMAPTADSVLAGSAFDPVRVKRTIIQF